MTIETIRKLVEKEFSLDISVVNRQTEYVRARFLYYYLSKKYTNVTLEKIGAYLVSDKKPEGFNHASVLHGVRSIVTDIEMKQFEYPKKYQNIVAQMMVDTGHIVSDMMEENIQIREIRNQFMKKIAYMTEKFEKDLAMIKIGATDEVIKMLKAEFNVGVTMEEKQDKMNGL